MRRPVKFLAAAVAIVTVDQQKKLNITHHLTGKTISAYAEIG